MARLRRVDCSESGIVRRRRGKGFEYLDADGRRITEPSVLERIRELAIPPAWEDVWICPYPMGHIQATGIDAAGRKQYRYHDRWRERRDAEKFESMIRFARCLPQLRGRVAKDLRKQGTAARQGAGLRRAAARPRLLPDRLGGLRRGERHLRDRDDGQAPRDGLRATRSTFDYEAKGGQRRLQTIGDPEVAAARARRSSSAAAAARSCSPTRSGRRWVDVKSADINEYVKAAAGEEFSAKDFRTWSGTVLAAVALAVSGPARGTKSSRKRAKSRAVKEVARYLGNTPTVARTSYIDPRVFDRFDGGLTIAGRAARTWPRTRPPGRTCRARSRRACSTCSPRTANRTRSRRRTIWSRSWRQSPSSGRASRARDPSAAACRTVCSGASGTSPMLTPRLVSGGQIATKRTKPPTPAAEAREAHVHEAARGRHAGQVGHALGLGEAVVHQPGLALERGRGVRVERLVAVEQDVALEVQEHQRVERHARELGQPRQRRVGPALGPVGAHEHHAALGDAAVAVLPAPDVGHLEGVVEVLLDLRARSRSPRACGRRTWAAARRSRPARAPSAPAGRAACRTGRSRAGRRSPRSRPWRRCTARRWRGRRPARRTTGRSPSRPGSAASARGTGRCTWPTRSGPS